MFERLCLEAFQSGLSWHVVLRKRAAMRLAFADFEVDRVAAFEGADVARILGDAGVIRNSAKIEATIANARRIAELRAQGVSFVDLVWSFRPAPGGVRSPAAADWQGMPAATPASEALARALRRAMLKFVGPTAAYALMQAAGLVNDHFVDCHVRKQVEREQEAVAVAPPRSPTQESSFAVDS